jgi:hypothetical protein
MNIVSFGLLAPAACLTSSATRDAVPAAFTDSFKDPLVVSMVYLLPLLDWDGKVLLESQGGGGFERRLITNSPPADG